MLGISGGFDFHPSLHYTPYDETLIGLTMFGKCKLIQVNGGELGLGANTFDTNLISKLTTIYTKSLFLAF